jgi:nitroimidazol reductase NimA-like FMN-containing flavoprotein (pyridoxamine 5'-phosphate oxidase superfamily)
MPGYGIAEAGGGKGLLPWSWALERLTAAHNYFVATTRPDGRPHVMPVWGVWLDDAFYFSTGAGSRKARNLAANASCTVTTERADEAVIVEGVAEEATDADALRRFVEVYHEKYDWEIDTSGGGIYAVRPRTVFGLIEANDNFAKTATRWTFD